MASTKPCKYEVLIRPVLTEKSPFASEGNNRVVVFFVHPDATKHEISEAVKKVFNVNVEEVRTSNVLGKMKRGKFGVSRLKARKKAFIKLEKGSSIDVLEGI